MPNSALLHYCVVHTSVTLSHVQKRRWRFSARAPLGHALPSRGERETRLDSIEHASSSARSQKECPFLVFFPSSFGRTDPLSFVIFWVLVPPFCSTFPSFSAAFHKLASKSPFCVPRTPKKRSLGSKIYGVYLSWCNIMFAIFSY
jgi:hypothetical protein